MISEERIKGTSKISKYSPPMRVFCPSVVFKIKSEYSGNTRIETSIEIWLLFFLVKLAETFKKLEFVKAEKTDLFSFISENCMVF